MAKDKDEVKKEVKHPKKDRENTGRQKPKDYYD